jgi:hypothetical protein
MHTGKLVFAQLTEHLSPRVFAQCVSRYAGKYSARSFSHWDQLLCMMFAQLTSRASLRDITVCLQSYGPKLYHAGIRGSIARTTLADANEQRDCNIFRDFACHLIGIARPLYAHEALAVQLDQTVYAIDSSMIDLCLSLFAWAPAAKSRAGVKVHASLDLRGNIPAFIRITGARESDASFLDDLPLEAGSFYVMDRGYVHFKRLVRFTHAAAFFVVRTKGNLHYRVVHCELPAPGGQIRRDEHVANHVPAAGVGLARVVKVVDDGSLIEIVQRPAAPERDEHRRRDDRGAHRDRNHVAPEVCRANVVCLL